MAEGQLCAQLVVAHLSGRCPVCGGRCLVRGLKGHKHDSALPLMFARPAMLTNPCASYPLQPPDKASAEACTAGEALDWLRWGAARDPVGCDTGVSSPAGTREPCCHSWQLLLLLRSGRPCVAASGPTRGGTHCHNVPSVKQMSSLTSTFSRTADNESKHALRSS